MAEAIREETEAEEMKEEKETLKEEEVSEEKKESQKEAPEEEISEEEAEKLPFPTAAIVRIMKANMDSEKMIKKDVKISMNRWLGEMCARVSREMNRFPYVMMHLNEFKEGKRIYEDMDNFDREKQRILAHLDAIKKDIERLERDLGKIEEDVITFEGKKG